MTAKTFTAIVTAVVLAVAVGACGETGKKAPSQAKQVAQHAKKQRAYLPKNDVELNNYNKAQKLYDTPTNIIWCTTTWGNPSSPMVTIPVAGKLTSSSTTFFAPEYAGGYSGDTALPSRSVDGLYHPNPPQYRYGFTPGGQYVDFFNMPTLCTTALTKFQRQQTKLSIEVDPGARAATKKAEAALRAGDKAGAQKALDQISKETR